MSSSAVRWQGVEALELGLVHAVIRDELLAPLLKLNAGRAEEEQLAGMAAAAAPMKRSKSRGNKSADNSQAQLV